MLPQVQSYTRGVITMVCGGGTGPTTQLWELAPDHPVHRSLWFPNEPDVVAMLVITAEMGQATARAHALTLSGLERLALCRGVCSVTVLTFLIGDRCITYHLNTQEAEAGRLP